MIRYALSCDQDHDFEAWFGSSEAYDDQSVRGLVECPFCASRQVKKQIMSPAVAGTKKSAENKPDPRTMVMEAMAKARRHVEQNFDYVGGRFAAEARDIHLGETEARGIYGEATPDEVRELAEEGVPVAPLPPAATPVRAKTELN